MAERFRPASRTEADGIGEVLRAIVGPEHVRLATEVDAVAGVVPLVVVEPADERQTASVLRCANQAGLAVIPCGGGTKLDWGNPSRQADVVLSVRRLNQVIEHAWADLTVTVEAGCTVAQLQRTLAQHGQRLAVDPLWPERATIGGILATNDSGTLRLGYGALRDLIIGVTLALADGTIASSGGKVVKNVAGYDLPKLATGSLGTLGVITRAVFRLHPLPRNTRTLTIAVGDADAMQRVILSILGEQLAPAAVQARDGNVDILLEGTLDGIAAQESVIKKFGEVREGSPAVWKAREDLWPSSGAGPIVKFTTLPSRISAAAAPLSRFVIQATGIGYARFDGDVQELRAAMERDGGSLMILGATKLDAWGSPGDSLPLMRAVKEQFDPKGTLNPGRFVGGI
ncbi:MAG: FAD-binding oxidoreductase [Acidobacteriia bacterium]|nr:FAD-binding oxidoreductase [Terriglobia bacterium]